VDVDSVVLNDNPTSNDLSASKNSVLTFEERPTVMLVWIVDEMVVVSLVLTSCENWRDELWETLVPSLLSTMTTASGVSKFASMTSTATGDKVTSSTVYRSKRFVS